MDELIESLWIKFHFALNTDASENVIILDKEDFGKVIKDSCKAQRFACLRVYTNRYDNPKHVVTSECYNNIINAEVIEKDYVGNLITKISRDSDD